MSANATLSELLAGLTVCQNQGGVWAEGVRLMLNATGPLNAHLAFPTDHSLLSQNRYDRATPLPLDTPIFGDFLFLTYFGHDPSLVLSEHTSLDDMQECILGGSGSLNIWTNAQFAFHKLQPLPFQIRYTNRHGSPVIFDIEKPETVKAKRDLTYGVYRDVQFTWLHPGGG